MHEALDQNRTTARVENQETTSQGQERLLAAGGIVGAIIAASCCVVPLVLVTLGVSGAWISSLTALEPYKPYFLTVTAMFTSNPKGPVPLAHTARARDRAALPRPLCGSLQL